MNSFGEYLRRERESREVSLEQLSDRIRVNIKYLRAFEEDDIEGYPQDTYARGFLRSYAEALGLDTERVIKRYQYFLKQYREGQRLKRRAQLRVMGRRVSLVAAPLLVLGAVAVAALVLRPGGGDVPRAEESALPTRVPVDPRLQVTALEEVWVRVRLDDAREYTVLMAAGETRFWDPGDTMEVSAARSGAVRVTYRGEEYTLAASVPGGPALWRWPSDTEDEEVRE